MPEDQRSRRVARFGVFELDLESGELRKNGLRVPLQEQPFRMLELLLERPGKVITREEVRNKLWPSDTFVEFDRALNTAVNKIREALGDSANNPRFIETLPRRGYRFLALANGPESEPPAAAPQAAVPEVLHKPLEQSPPESARWRNREVVLQTLVAILSIAVVALAVIHFWQRPAETRVIRLQVSLPNNVRSYRHLPAIPVISPDGQHLVIAGASSNGKSCLWVRSLDSLTAQPLPGTESPSSSAPFWSPDSHFIAFHAVADGKGTLKKIDVRGGPPQTLCYARGLCGGTWNREGVILFAQEAESPTGGNLYRVPAAGGEPAPVHLDTSWPQNDFPHFLPDGRHFVYRSQNGLPSTENGAIFMASLDSKETRMLIPGASNVSFAQPGFLIYGRHETLLAQAFDVRKLQVTDEPSTVADHVGRVADDNFSFFSVSQNGILTYSSATSENVQLAWYGRDGKRLGSIGEAGRYEDISLSSDLKHLAVQRRDPHTAMFDIWTVDLSNGIFTPLTFHVPHAQFPVWSPDGRDLVFSSDRKGDDRLVLDRWAVGGGAEERLLEPNQSFQIARQWLTNASVLFTSGSSGDFYLLPLHGKREPELLLKTESRKASPHVSPDGRWVAYQSNESGQWEVYLAAFPTFTEKRRVSNKGGCQALWRRDGHELFYLSLDGELMSADLTPGATLATGVPRALFQTPAQVEPDMDQYAVTGDGKKFIFLEPLEQEDAKPITVVLNWTARLKR